MQNNGLSPKLSSQVTNSSIISEILSPEITQQMGKDSSFCIRERELTVEAFVEMCCDLGGGKKYSTLEECCEWLECRYKIKITKQGLHERFDQRGVKLFELLLRFVTERKMMAKLDVGCREWLSFIWVFDSTIQELGNKCREVFKGFGGGATDAGIKIHYGYDLLSGSIWHAIPGDAKNPDMNFHPASIPENALLLFDLGFFSLLHLREIISSEAYFLCRIKSTTRVYVKRGSDYELVNLLEISRKMKHGASREIQVFLGDEQKIEVRLFLEKLTPQLAAEKRRKLKSNKENKRKKLSKERLEFCDINAFITNLPQEKVSAQMVRHIYCLRWQIEIVFKTWKSILGWDELINAKPERVACLLYGRLIKIFIVTNVFWIIKIEIWNETGQEISELKSMGRIAKEIRNWTLGLIFSDSWMKLKKTLARFALKETKGQKPSPMEILSVIGLT